MATDLKMKNNTYKELVDENIEKNKGKGLSESYSNQLQKNEIINPIEKANIIKKCRIEIFKKKINNIFIGLHIFAFILYVISLKHCKGGQENYCVSYFIKTFIYLAFLAVANSLIVSIYLTLLIRKKIHYFHLFYLFPFYIIVYIYDHGDDFNRHGEFNLEIFLLFLVIFFIVINFVVLVILIIKKKRFIILLLILIILYLPVQYFLYISSITICDDWDQGLNSEKLENYNNSNCKFGNPPNCKMKYYYGKLDLTKLIGTSNHNKKRKAVKYLNKTLKKSNYLGYPYSNIIPVDNVFNNFFFHNFAPQHMIDMETFNETKDNPRPEVTVKFNFWGDGKVEINLRKNETLAQERKKLENPNSLYKNILIIYIDAISRSRFLLALKNLSKFIEKFMKKDRINKDFSSYQFFKYHGLGTYTHINVQPMFYGESMQTSSGIDFAKYGRENGYITGQSNNHCAHTLFNDEKQYGTKNVETIFYDHELFTLFCDPNYYDKKMSSSFNRGPSSFTRRIFYGKDSFEYELEYLRQFWEKYKDNRKLFRMAFMDAHEDTGEVVKYLDKPLTNFLIEFEQKGYLNDTFIMFVSDHGLHFPRVFGVLAFDNYDFERMLPSLFIISGKKIFNDTEIYNNQNKFVTAYDIHSTLINIIYGNDFQKYKRHNVKGISLFDFINDEIRNCSLYPEISEGKCRCF